MTFRAWRYFLVLLILTAVAGSAALRPARAWMADPTRWGPWQAGSGWLGHYLSAHRVPAGWVVFSNVAPVAGGALCPGASCPGLVRYEGPSLAGPARTMRARLVFPNKKISDLVDTRGRRLANRMLTRAVVRRDPVDGSWHAIVHVSDGYGRGRGPADGRVEPAYLSSRRGIRWTYHGRLGGDVGAWLAGRAYWGSSLALVVNERPGAGVESKFVLAMDGVLPGGGLALAVSNDGRSWSFVRDAAGRIRNVAPAEIAHEALHFPSIVRVGRTWRMVAVDGWPPTRHRHMVSCDGLVWTLLGDPASPSPTFEGPLAKNVALATDGATLYAMAAGRLRAAPWVPFC